MASISMRGFLGINLGQYGADFEKINLDEIKDKNLASEYHITLIFFKEISEAEVRKIKKE